MELTQIRLHGYDYDTAQTRASNKYNSKAYDRIALQVKKGQTVDIQAHAAALGKSTNGFINRAIAETMERGNKKSKDE